MPTHTTNFDREQFSYIDTTADDDGFSKRARELVELGMAVEQTDLPEAADIMADKNEEFSPNAEDALHEVVNHYIESHE